jgi:hypothetical protein
VSGLPCRQAINPARGAEPCDRSRYWGPQLVVLAERINALVADDEMVQHGNAQKVTGGAQAVGDRHIFLAGEQLAGVLPRGMIVLCEVSNYVQLNEQGHCIYTRLHDHGTLTAKHNCWACRGG